MSPLNPSYRNLVVASLLAAVVLAGTSLLLMPDFTGGPREQLESIGSGGATAVVSALTFTLAQLPMAVGLVGVAHLIRRGAPVLAALGGTLIVLGCFGHAVHGGVSNVMLEMAGDPAHLDIHASVLQAGESGVHLPFLAVSLVGTVLGTVLLAVGLLRSRVAPTWVPWVLIGWVVVEFVGGNFSEWAVLGSGLLFAGGFAGLALTVARSAPREWVAGGLGAPVEEVRAPLS